MMSDRASYSIFLSYRREDSQDTVGHIYDRLKERFGAEAIFIDVDAIPPGYDFASYINHVLRQCQVVLIVIGPSWPNVTAKDGSHAGQPRLADSDDHVRIETEQALALAAMNDAGEPVGRLRLIPLLVQGAQMPKQEQLPPNLQRLTRFNSASVQRYPQFDHDMQRLIGVIDAWTGADSPVLPPRVDSSAQSSADPIAELLARFLPQLRDAFNTRNWPQVSRLYAFIQRNVPAERLPNEVYTIQGQALMAERDFAGAKATWDLARARDPLDVVALRAAADTRIALGERSAALPLLEDALTLTNDRANRLPLLRLYASTLSEVTSTEVEKNGASAQTRWATLLQVANEGLTLEAVTDENDAVWLATKLEALDRLGYDGEALAVARQLTARPEATVAQWLTHARLAWKLAGETPTDEVRAALDTASRLAPNNPAIVRARADLLVILKPERFPPRLAELGFTAQARNGVKFIIPPLCAVPAGDFLMGSDPTRDKDARTDEQPQHRVNLAAFSIGRFPVTVAEYACFVEATRRPQPQQWPSQMRKLDHPVIYVSWEDAAAYAAWLAQATGQLWRLPTEAEWEKAARWDPHAGVARRYPWGDAFDPSRANTIESGMHGTSAVGRYFSGASPYGAQEMAGNVWEWTYSLFKLYPYIGSDGPEIARSTENRVLRGGSWYSFRHNARAAFRNLSGPGNLDNFFGFRLAVVISGLA